MSDLNLPPLHWIGAGPTPDDRIVALADADSIEARERILMERIAELEKDKAGLQSVLDTISAFADPARGREELSRINDVTGIVLGLAKGSPTGEAALREYMRNRVRP